MLKCIGSNTCEIKGGKQYRGGKWKPSHRNTNLIPLRGGGGGRKTSKCEPQAVVAAWKRCSPAQQAAPPQDRCRAVPCWAETPRAYSPVVFRHWSGTAILYDGKESACQCNRPRRHRFDPCVGKDPFEKEIAAHSSIFAWKSPWTEVLGRLQSMGWEKVRHNWTRTHTWGEYSFRLNIAMAGVSQRHCRWRLLADCVPYSWMALVFLKEEPGNTSLWLHLKTTCLIAAAAAAAESLQSSLTLCEPIDGSPPGSSVPGILQARTLEWVAISLSNVCVHAKPLQSCLLAVDKRIDHHLQHWGQELIQKKV